MVGISEVICTDPQGAPVVETGQGAFKSGTETENLFAMLLAALSGGLLVSQCELDGVVLNAGQEAGSDVAVDGTGAVGAGAPLPWAGSCGSQGGMPSAQVAVADVASVAANAEAPASVTDAAANGEAVVLQAVPDADGTAGEQAAVLSVQNVEQSAELGSPPDANANAPPGSLTQVASLAQAEEAVPVAVEDPGPVARESPAEAQVPQPEGRPVETGKGTQQVVSEETGFVSVEDGRSAASESKAGAKVPPPAEAESVPSGSGPARVATHLSGQDAPMETQQDAQPGGDDVARGSSEKFFLEHVAHSQGGGAQRAVNATSNTLSRVSDFGATRLTDPVIEQTVKSVLLSVREGTSEVRVRMQPDHLGELHLRLVFRDNALSLDVNTQSTIVKSIIESNLGQLRQSLHSNGVDVGKVSVTVDPDVSSGGHFSRETSVFQPSESEWTGTYRGHHEQEERPLEEWFRGARMRHAVNRLDLVA